MKLRTLGLKLIEDLVFISELVQIVTELAVMDRVRTDERLLSVR